MLVGTLRSLRAAAVLAALFLVVGCGGKAAPAGGTPTKPAAAPAPLLWTVQKGDQKAYLYGTIHAGGERLVHPAAFAALAESKVFAMETDVANIDQGALLARARLPEGTTLDTLLSPGAWTTLVAAVGRQLPEPMLKTFKPWFVSVLLVQSWVPPGGAVDDVLLQRAKAQGATLAYLETVDEQLGAIELALTAKDLELLLADLEKARKQTEALFAAYEAGDADALVALSQGDDAMSPEAREVLLYKRNRAWVPKIVELTAGGGAFIAVGTAHIVGPGGLVELLSAEGYTVTRVAAAAPPAEAPKPAPAPAAAPPY